MQELIPVRCPGTLVKPDNKIYACNALLFKCTAGSKVECVCRKCHRKLTVVVRPTLNGNPIVDIRESTNV